MLVRLVTCRPLPEIDTDEEPLLAALRGAGLDARLAVWDDPAEDWKGGLSVIRSTWDYHHRLDAFLAWVDRAAATSRLLNPPGIVRFSAHKSYLAKLEAAGLPVIPTVHLARGERVRLADIMADRGWPMVVVKPSVSAGSFRTERFQDGKAGQPHLDGLLAERDVLVQPYLASVDGHGERAVVWIDGAVTHSVRKSPRFGSDQESVSVAVQPAEDERRTAEAFVSHVGAEKLLYARVDVARDERGKPLLMELELVEPSLFLIQHPPALEKFVRAIAARARS